MNDKTNKDRPVFIKNELLLKNLVKKYKPFYVDAFSSQIKELFIIKNSVKYHQNKDFLEGGNNKDFLIFKKKNERNYTHIYFPWNNTLIKSVNQRDFFELKTNRNKNLITKEDQKRLALFRIGVLGMSVGSNVAIALTQAGISKEITISDFDVLENTNLNRILAGVHQIGINKSIIASRKIYEDNPFAKINILPNGINERNLNNLLQKNKLDCIIDEIDNLKIKIDIRKLAKKYKIPVLMLTDNGDGVVLHIERYDLGYDKIFNKKESYWDALLKKELTKKEMGMLIVNDIVGGIDKVDKNMINSVKLVGEGKLVSWPQLGSAALLAGVVATFALKELARDKTLYIRKNFDLSLK